MRQGAHPLRRLGQGRERDRTAGGGRRRRRARRRGQPHGRPVRADHRGGGCLEQTVGLESGWLYGLSNRCFTRSCSSSRFSSPPRWWASSSRSEEHTSELQSLMRNSYAVFCFHKKNTQSL